MILNHIGIFCQLSYRLRKKQLRGEKTREKIVKTSLKLFSEKGYDKVTLDEIVKKRHIKRVILPTLFSEIGYFFSKIHRSR
ncbi:TetR/AcrR family transcriptional regulator [Peribacillus simplex]|uniref:TetR/AcrR family transcriptional regulator n=1 Tax=Peribacillus simplex TaxID=1478 RepID=UPI00333B1A49